ncbi:SDR family NAD(P)-dependent oxidoreductase [Plantactinospora mayteni]|uniref:Short-chain type dehydrogenase/reductase n=1 Tax=Plantactinospora mayteni TaxID=566021 RepID=A0ABQ4F4Q9_9ACTN|nr:SDR family NAD(P)-dependent oxidoreductase [Plantactinospora mayteni]GIH01868.1 short-chain type dehydrogenase/reductase [Plantactinospora mayteni]
MDRIAGTTSFITGAAQGIGLGIARSLARHGSRLALVDIDDSALASAADELAALTEVHTFHLDVRDRAGYARVADEAEARLGPVSVLCNNAGIAFPEAIEDMSYELWDLAVGINLGGVVNGIQTFLPRMLNRDAPGHIVNTASAAGLVAGVGCMYTAAKFGVVGLSEALRKRLDERSGHRIGVTVLCPGGVTTNIAHSTRAVVAAQRGGDATFGRAQTRIDEMTPKIDAALRQFGVAPDEVGNMVVRAIEADQFYILTDHAGVELITERTSAILAGIPGTDPVGGSLADFRRTIHDEQS